MTLSKISDIAVIGFCLVGGAYAGLNMLSLKTVPTGAVRPGEIIPDSPGLALHTAARTLVLITSSHCRFCVDSVAFYRTLAAVARETHTRMVAATMESPEVNRQFLANNGIAVERAIAALPNHIEAGGTPTLLLVGQDGSVVQSWTGKLTRDGEAQVLKALRQGPALR